MFKTLVFGTEKFYNTYSMTKPSKLIHIISIIYLYIVCKYNIYKLYI